MRKWTNPGLASLILIFFAGSVQAALLNLNQDYPLVVSFAIQVDYNATSDTFTADGFTDTASIDGNPINDVLFFDGVFELSATIDSSGNATSASLLVTGDLDGINTVTLFQSNTLSAFGSASDDLFEFEFINATGALATGDKVGVLLDAISISEFGEPVFTSDFSNNGNGKSDTFMVPEPATACLFILGGALGMMRPRRTHS